MNEYLSAAEARKLTEKARDINGEYKRKETEKVLGEIRNIASQGGTTCTTNFKMDDIVRDRLISLAYTVEYFPGDQRDPGYTTIGWM